MSKPHGKDDAPAPGKLSQVPGAVRQPGAKKSKDNPMGEMLANTHLNTLMRDSVKSFDAVDKEAADVQDADGEPEVPGRKRRRNKRAKEKRKARAYNASKKAKKPAVDPAADEPPAEEKSSSSGIDDGGGAPANSCCTIL